MRLGDPAVLDQGQIRLDPQRKSSAWYPTHFCGLKRANVLTVISLYLLKTMARTRFWPAIKSMCRN